MKRHAAASLAAAVLAACGPRGDVGPPLFAHPPTPARLAGRWIARRSVAVKTGRPGIRQTTDIVPADADVEVFDASGGFTEPPDTSAASHGRYRISGDTVVVRTADGDSTVWFDVRVTRRWLVETTDHGAVDFDGDGKTEWATITFLCERQP